MQNECYRIWRTHKDEVLEGKDCTIVSSGVAKAYVVYDKRDVKSCAAAEDFISSIKKMTGVILATSEFEGGIPIYIGKIAAEKKKDLHYVDGEGFYISVDENEVIAFGNDEGLFEGTEMAVTALLDELGFGWYGYEELWQVVPKSDTAVLKGIRLLSRPHFNCRRNRVLEQQPELGRRWGLGGILSEVDHKFGSFLPPHIYMDEHPEYYALSKGTRDIKDKKWWQLCLSNKQVQSIIAEKVKQFFKEHPDWTGISIGQNDGNGHIDSIDYSHWCECEECKKYASDISGTLLRFANEIAKEVYEEYPDKTLMFYGYFGTYKAPENNIPEKVSPNLQLTLCKECGFTGRIRTNESCSDEEHPDFAENFNNWKSMGLKHMAIYEWNCPGAANPAWKETFFVQGDIGLDNLRWFYENGVDFVYFDQGPNDCYERAQNPYTVRWPQWYPMALGCFNTGLSFEDIMLPACNRLYGNAGEAMFEFYSSLADALSRCREPHFNWGLPLVGEVYTDEAIESIEALIKKAEATEGLSQKEQERIAVQRREWEGTKRMSVRY